MPTYKSPKLMLCVRYTRTTFCCCCALTLTAAAVFQSSRAAGGRCYSCCCYRVSEWALYTYLPLGNLCQWWARPRQGNTRPGEPVHTKTPHGHLPPLHHLPHPHPPPSQVDLLKVSIFTSCLLAAASSRWATLAPSCSCRRRRSTRSPPRLDSPSSRSVSTYSIEDSVEVKGFKTVSQGLLCCEGK